MDVKTNSDRARKSQSMVAEMQLANVPDAGYKCAQDNPNKPHGELSTWADSLDVKPRPQLLEPRREQPFADASHPAIAVNMDACIQCNRCMRACREEQGNAVIGMAYRRSSAQIVFDVGDPLAESTCVACGECGECVQTCPRVL